MQRPASVTTFGILNIIFAVLGAGCMLGSMAMLSMPGAGQNPVFRAMSASTAYAAWMKITFVLGILASIVLLVAGIGLLRLKSWARKVSIGYAIYAIVFSLLGMVVNFLFVFQPILAEAARTQGPEAAAAIGATVGGIVGGFAGMIYPALLWIFMTRPKVVAAFQPATEPPIMPPA